MNHLNEEFGPNLAFSIGIGSATEGLESIRMACQAALTASSAMFYDGPGQVYATSSLLEPDHLTVLSEGFCREFRTCLRNSEQSEAIQMLHQLTTKARNQRSSDIPAVINAFFRLLMILHEFAAERNLTLPSDSQQEKFIWQDIARLPTLNVLYDYVEGNIRAVFSIWKEQSAVSAKIGNVIAYIRDHYTDPHLSTRIISERTYLSLSYMCALFKKETGKTVNEFITAFRLDKAKELLKMQHLKLYEVASMVGFNDANYFSSIFKKVTGMTPSDYREKERA